MTTMKGTQEKTWAVLAAGKNFSHTSTSDLQRWAEEYPYFAPVQYFLAARLRNNQSPLSATQMVKSYYYFTNPLLLQLHFQEKFTKVESPQISPDPMPAEIKKDAESEPEIQEPFDSGSKISGLLSDQLADFKKPVDPGAKLEIDTLQGKLHTIDYFASLGIKVDLANMPKDKLTTHLLKFTDWLKQMKQLDSGSVSQISSNPEREEAVAETAKNSNQPREILTEAMAEVLEKQGQLDKAIQLYIKLSFLIPEKSSYFAAKIEQLKGI